VRKEFWRQSCRRIDGELATVTVMVAMSPDIAAAQTI